MLARRVATSLVGAPVILGLVVWGGVAYSLAVAAVLALAALEFFAATDPEHLGSARPEPVEGAARPLQQRAPALLGVAAMALLVVAAHNGADWWTGALVLAVALTFLALILRGQTETALRDWLWVIGGLVYVGFLGSHLVLLRHLPNGRDWVILALFATFATDSAAYFVGRLLGSSPLAPRVSPGKTVEGFFGGLLGGFVAVAALNWLPTLRLDAAHIVPLALLLPLAAQLGDLAESLLKRSASVKDAGWLVPGHGGLLDRLDSVLFAAPLVYYYVLWVIL